ncbi:hypothetical protein ACFE04_003885 [Oxalis oulophora]
MVRSETKSKVKSMRKPLREVSNNGGVAANNRKIGEKGNGKVKVVESESDTITNTTTTTTSDDSLDRLLLVQSDLSSVARQIDELVVQAFKLDTNNDIQTKEIINSFTNFVSEMLSSLKPWVPRFQKMFSSPDEDATKLAQDIQNKSPPINEEDICQVESPEKTDFDSLVSPSPLVSWRANNCTIEGGRQLFLLTPLPKPNLTSSKFKDSTKSSFKLKRTEPGTSVEFPMFFNMREEANDDLLEGLAINPTPRKPSDFVSVEKRDTCDFSVLVMTPRLKMSPPRSCVLLESIQENSSPRGNGKFRKSTPFPTGLQRCRDFSDSESSGSETSNSNDLALKFPELLGFQKTYKPEAVKQDLDTSPNWLFSPPKSCVLFEPPNKKSVANVPNLQNLPVTSCFPSQQDSLSELKEDNIQVTCHQTKESCNQEPDRGKFELVASTPMFKEPESTFRTGKRPGENTLKKELWTRFEAASTHHGLHLDSSVIQNTAKKGFLEMLDEIIIVVTVLNSLSKTLTKPNSAPESMAQTSQLTQHIESFVDSARSSAQQAASINAIASLLQKDVLAIETLVRDMEMYLTTTDHIIRARGILLLAEVLTHLSVKPLSDATTHTLIKFFSDRVADWRALRGALVGCLAMMRRKSSGGMVFATDAKEVMQSLLQNVTVQSLAQHDRKLSFELLECLLERYADAIASMGDFLIYGICEGIDGEKDPCCLMLTFHIVELLAQLFPDPAGPLASFSEDLFEILGSYFPIHFIHSPGEDAEVKRDDLSRALMLAFSSTPTFEPFAIPLLLEKLSSSLPSAKLDSLKYLGSCTFKYGAERMGQHAKTIWSSLKDTIHTSLEFDLSFDSESSHALGVQKSEIAAEALILLQKVIMQNNDLYLDCIAKDEDINMVFKNISDYGSYDEIPPQNKQKLYVAGSILSVSAKASVTSCNRIFELFFPRLMDALGISVRNPNPGHSPNYNHIIAHRLNHGALYLCIELLSACRDLVVDSQELVLDFGSKNWCYFLQSFSAQLTEKFCTMVSKRSNEETNNADIYFGVNGLEILGTFPGGYLVIAKSLFENILIKFVSILTLDINKPVAWKWALKALGVMGSFIVKHQESEKELSYVGIVVEKIVTLAHADDSVMPFHLKVEAICVVGGIKPNYMLKVAQGIEEAVYANLSEVHGNLKSAETLVKLLECYSEKVIPWFHQSGNFEEASLKFVVNIWSQIENCIAFNLQTQEMVLLDAMMKAIKLSVTGCSQESQNIVIQKSCNVLSSCDIFPPKEKTSNFPVQLEELQISQETAKLSSRDEWILSLFASVFIALRPSTNIPNLRSVLQVFTTNLVKGSLSAAQALGSIVNKFSDGKVSGDFTLEDALDFIFSRIACGTSYVNKEADVGLLHGVLNGRFIHIHSIGGLSWIGKGLLLRGHEKVKDITMILLECLLSNTDVDPPPVIKCAADAFQILTSDTDDCLNKKFHAIIRPLYKQRFYSTMMPILQSLLMKTDSSFSRSMLYRALAHIISETPLAVVLNDAKKLLPIIVDALSILNKDITDRNILYGILLVMSGILTDEKGQEAVIDCAHIIVNCLIELIHYHHKMLVRETSIQCLLAMAGLPRARIYPMRIKVLQAVDKALDDPRRDVRKEAVRCRRAW